MVISHVTPLKMVISHLRFLLPLLALLSSMAASSTDSSSSIFEILRTHGLPMGLLPSGVTNFSLDNSGKFAVYLDRACNTKFENELHYEKNVSGSIRYGRIDGLSGISAQDLFLWFPVIEIRVDVPSSGLIYFDVGVVSKQFSLSSFETPRDCLAAPNPGRMDGEDTTIKILSRNLRYKLDPDNPVRSTAW